MLGTRGDHQASRVPSSPQHVENSKGRHFNDSDSEVDQRQITIPTVRYLRDVSTREAGPRAKHQRRAVMDGAKIPQRRSRMSSVREVLLLILIPALIVVLCRVFFIDVYVIPSGSMLNTLQVGDRIGTTKIFNLKRGDIVVFKDPAHWLGTKEEGGGPFSSEYLVKRLIGLPGDHVQCRKAGEKIEVNGVAIDETEYIRAGVDPSTMTFDVTVSEGHIFVLGDNRSNSADSRYHTNDGAQGFVPESDVVGVAKFVYWPLNHLKFMSRPDSVFAKVPDPTSTSK